MAGPIESAIEDRVAVVTLSRPEVNNAMNDELRAELLATIEAVEDDPDVRAVIVTGAGGNFSAGADINDFRSGTTGTAVSKLGRTMRLQRAMEAVPVPTIAAIDGYCLGGGVELAACMDFRLATEGATLGLPEVDIGIIPGAGGTQRVARLVGVPAAKELIFSGEHVPATEAHELGLVDHVVDGELLPAAREFAARFTGKPPVAIGAAKLALNKVWSGADLEHGLLYESMAANLTLETDDRDEGMAAFAEGREPTWEGR